MTRRQSRERAVQFLFQQEFDSIEFEAALSLFWKNNEARDSEKSFAEELIRGVSEHKEDLDARIRGYSEHWDINRMSGVDRNILRVALYEMFFRADIPPVVSINEAVDIAKRFGCSKSGGFVNGVLDRARKDLRGRVGHEP